MGKCSKCGKKIWYNAFKKIKGVIYCLKCVPKEEAITIMFDETIDEAKVDFTELAEELAKVPGTIVATTDKELTKELGEPLKLEILTKCKYCGCHGSSEWLELPNGEWCCKKKGCRKKLELDNECAKEKQAEE